MLKSLSNINAAKILFLDIETAHGEKELTEESEIYPVVEYTVSRRSDFKDNKEIVEYYNEKAPLIPELGQIVSVSFGYISGGQIRTTSFYNDGQGEKEMLEEVCGFLDEMKKNFTAVGGFNSNSFDIPYLITRMWAHGLFKICSLIDESNEKPWTKINVDLREAIRMGRPSAPSLLSLCTLLSVPSPKEAITGKEVPKAFFEGRIIEIKDYSERDVEATINCLLKLQGKEILPSVSVKIEKSYKEKGYASELDKLFATEEVDLEGLSKEGAKLTKKEQDLYVKLVETLKVK